MPFTIGWAEWVALPDLGLPAIKAKVDTGARTSALHAFQVEPFGPPSTPMVRFGIHPIPGRTDVVITCSAPVIDQREVTSSNGERETRCVIATSVSIGERSWPIEVTLANRETMAYRMLLGRQAIRGDVRVDPAASYLQPRLGYRLYRHLPRQDLVHRPLRIALLTRRPGSASNRRLAAAAAARGHVLEPLDLGRMALVIDAAEPLLLVGNTPVAHYDAVVPRLSPGDGAFGAAAVRQLEMMGSYAVNPGDALDRLLNPVATKQKLIARAVPLPVETLSTESETKARAGRPFAASLRFLVVGREVAAVLERRLGKDYDASGRKLGDERAMAVAAAEALELRLAGIDIGETRSGPAVLRVSAAPALGGFETVTGARVAEPVIADIESRVRSWRRIEPAQRALGEAAG
ncbi:MAG: RimK/LysX family protein [Hyphomicrobiaceae bacterium]|nr:RimK/LysX family protein [Hyphomicrobiaceae bacterium]